MVNSTFKKIIQNKYLELYHHLILTLDRQKYLNISLKTIPRQISSNHIINLFIREYLEHILLFF